MQAWTLANCTAVAVYCSITTSDVQERLSAQSTFNCKARSLFWKKKRALAEPSTKEIDDRRTILTEGSRVFGDDQGAT